MSNRPRCQVQNFRTTKQPHEFSNVSNPKHQTQTKAKQNRCQTPKFSNVFSNQTKQFRCQNTFPNRTIFDTGLSKLRAKLDAKPNSARLARFMLGNRGARLARNLLRAFARLNFRSRTRLEFPARTRLNSGHEVPEFRRALPEIQDVPRTEIQDGTKDTKAGSVPASRLGCQA
jgi:hypothetical protein